MMRSVANGFALALALTFVTPAAALACTVDSSVRGPTVEERTRAADYVIVGWVERTHEESVEGGEAGFWDTLFAMGRGRVADIAVHEWLKGDGPGLITVTGFARGHGECRSLVPEGTAVIFLSGDAEDGELALNQISVHDAVARNSPEVIRRVRDAAVD